MSTDLNVNLRKVAKSFSFAFQGISTALKNERNIKIHVCVSGVVLLLGLWFSLSKIEWLFILLAIGGMIALELLNTAIERIVDLVTEEFHPLAKQAKDIAAGAVLIYAILSVIIGLIIFFPKLIKFL